MLERLSIRQKFQLLSLIAIASFCCAAAVVWSTLRTVQVNGPLYEQIVNGHNLVADVLPPPGNLLQPYLVALQLRAVDAGPGRASLADELGRLRREFDGSVRRWERIDFPGEMRRDKGLADGEAQRFFTIAFNLYLPALVRNDIAAANASLVQLGDAYTSQRAHLARLIRDAEAYNLGNEQAARDRIFMMSMMLLSLGLVVIVAYSLTLHRVQNSIVNPIDELLRIARGVLSGDWLMRPSIYANDDEAGELLLAIRKIVETTQEELLKAEKMAALGSLVAGISHELNTPLGNSLLAVTTVDGEVHRFRDASRGGVRRLSLDQFVDAVEHGVQLAQRNLERATELVQSFKQVAVDRSTSQRRKFLLDQVIADTLSLLQPQLKRIRCAVVSDVESGVQMDSYPGPLGQVLSNLIENAVRHGLEACDGGALEIRVRSLPEKVVRITVKDDGCGMAADIQRQVFDPFFTTKMGCGGTGLGLHIVHNIVYQLLGGMIHLRSEPEKGSEFELLLPLIAPSLSTPREAYGPADGVLKQHLS